ncbi:MAG: phage holin family protein [Clostridium sp.]
MKSFSADAIIQGVLVTGASVYTNQIVKQIKKEN